MNTEATELKLFIDNDAELYRRMAIPIYRNQVTKMARGLWNPTLSVKGFKYLVDAGAKEYVRAHCGRNVRVRDVFDSKTRWEVAQHLSEDFLVEAVLGNYNELLPKKYKGKGFVTCTK